MVRPHSCAQYNLFCLDKEGKIIEMDIADTIMERPYEFHIGEMQFYLYPATLGKIYLLSRLTENLEINTDFLSLNPYMEALRLCDSKRDIICKILSYHTFDKKEELFNSHLINERQKLFEDNLSNEELAQLFIIVLSKDNIEQFIKHFQIDIEKKEQEKISIIKKKKCNTITFGGKSIYGTLIDIACERYGWTMDYVVWGISYANLHMLLNDYITSIYLTDDEIKKYHISTDRTFINGDDPKNMDKIKGMKWH